jgi:hypothetical protein
MQKEEVAYPVGLRCTNVRWLTQDEANEEGWDDIRWNNTAVIEFNDGSKIYASCDPEGNGPGSIFGSLKDGTMFTVMPLEDIKGNNS